MEDFPTPITIDPDDPNTALTGTHKVSDRGIQAFIRVDWMAITQKLTNLRLLQSQ